MIDLQTVIHLHGMLEKPGMCLPGIRDENLLYSAINGQHWYETDVDQLLHVSYSICANHVFNDGNKRTAYLVLHPILNHSNSTAFYLAQLILELAMHTFSKEIFFNRSKTILGLSNNNHTSYFG